jgi:putative nucleotidyltransferase with HDIG domain
VAAGLEAALRVRAAAVHASTPMVRSLAARVCQRLGLGAHEQALVDVCARVRDIGMIGLSDEVVLATGPLSPREWELMNLHPVIGAELLEGLPALEEAAAIVRSHHERWDGDGYPDGLEGKAIPLLSRVLAVCDAFVAMASDRPHRRGMSPEAALEHIEQDSARQFDPDIADALIATLTNHAAPTVPGRRAGPHPPVKPPSRPASRADLKDVLATLETVPAFGPAIDRVLEANSAGATPLGRDLIATIESDLGLTIAILRAVQGVGSKRRIASVTDAVHALTSEQIEHAAGSVQRAAFPARTPTEALLHHLRIHSQAVYRAAQRLAMELELKNGDEFLTAALLHDIGKLALAQSRPELASHVDAKTATPEERIRAERQALSLDHASIGALLITRWDLPAQLSDTVAAHHSATDPGQTATLIRLADLIAHQAHNDAVDRKLLLGLASDCGLSPKALRDALFDLPHAGGSRRARAQPSPLSQRETATLRHLAQGKVYSQIALDLGLTASTVRSHLHNAYTKMQVADRAQAVLRATEMGWI